MSGFNFGAVTGSTNTTVPGSNVLFGTQKTSASTGISMGSSTTTSAPLFGSTSAQPSSLTFGTAPSGLSFGATPTTGTSSFGAPAVSTAPSTTGLFGAAPQQPGQAGISFGQPATTTAASFGAATTTGLSFGLPASTSQAGFSFSSTPSSLPTGISFGSAPATTSTGLGAASVTKPLTLSFGTTTAASSMQSSGFSTGGGLFGTAAKPLSLGQPTASTLNLGGSVPAVSLPSVGLGGADTSQAKAGQPGAASSKTDRVVKENQVPNEITHTIEGFKTFVKTQKSLSSDIARGSAKPLHKVQEDTEALRQMLTAIKSGLQRNRSLADRLKADTAKSIHDAEMAQRTHDTPPGLQYDNTAPLQYFSDLVTKFENEMQKFRQEIENAEKHLQSLCEPVALTPQELSLAMRHLHDSFIALAGRLQMVHNSVEAQKEQYLNLRKYFLKDPTNVFEEAKKISCNTMKPIVPTRISLGPTPFSPMGNQHRLGLLPAALSESSSSFSAGKSLGK